jgi:hypothetical protein
VTTYLFSCPVIQHDDRIEKSSPQYGVDTKYFLENCWFRLSNNKSDPSRSDVAGNVQNTKAHDWEP